MNSGEGKKPGDSLFGDPDEDDLDGHTVNVSARLRANDPELLKQQPPSTSYLQGLVAPSSPSQLPSAQVIQGQGYSQQTQGEFHQSVSTQSHALDSSVWTESGELLPGALIADKYEVMSLIGKGGMSSVYKIKHTQLDTILALKLLDKSLWTDPDAVKRFKLEAQTIGRLTHPNLITYRDFGITSGGQPYLVMDYVDGSTLSDRIRPNQGIFLPTVIEIFQQLAEGLKIAHDQGIVHRDIKPGNIMFVSEGSDQLKLVDFGLAKIITEDGGQGLTRTGDVFGSPLYMSPEQCLGKKVDHRSDIYSIGCVIYEAMTGKLPLKGNTILETMNNHVEKMHPKMTDIDQGLIAAQRASWVNVEDLQYIVLRCLQKKPGDRYATLDELLADLLNLKKQAPVEKRELTTGTIKRLRDVPTERANPMQMLGMLGAVAFVIFGVGVAGVGVWWFMQPKPTVAVAEKEKPKTASQNPLLDGSMAMEDAASFSPKAQKYMEAGNFKQAKTLWTFAVESYEAKGNADAMVADSLVQKGICCHKLEQYDEAIASYDKALGIYKKMPEDLVFLQLKECMMKKAQTLRELNSLAAAEALEQEAVALEKRAKENLPQ